MNLAVSSPRPWGCFWQPFGLVSFGGVFPTPVGVFPAGRSVHSHRLCLPHARGGVSSALSSVMFSTSSSPRPWGCFRMTQHLLLPSAVFPTPVGVFPDILLPDYLYYCLPHARGGVSDVGIDEATGKGSSPRPWGCFLLRQTPCQLTPVFPTPVGVFPRLWRSEMARSSLPYTRGGVSIADGTRFAAVKSSPRPWGCF